VLISCFINLSLVKKIANSHWVHGLVGPDVGLDLLEEINLPFHNGNRTPVLQPAVCSHGIYMNLELAHHDDN